jgi:hypothetical protein
MMVNSSSQPLAVMPFVSVIVPTYNNAFHLRECLASLVGQDYPRFEVILVDNGSTDGTARIAARFPDVRYVYFNRAKSSYAARNEGVRHANGEVLAFFDADQTARPNFLRLLLEEYVPGDPRHVYVGRLDDDPRVPQVLREFFPWLGNTEGQLAGEIQTAAVAVPRELFRRLGGFKEHLLSGGDFEFFARAVKVAKVHQNREVGAMHYYARGVGHYLRKEERAVFGRCLLAQASAQPGPRIRAFLGEALVGLAKRAVDSMLIPVRFPPREWPLRWQAQIIRCLKLAYRLKAVVRFKLGQQRAGDLPRDARVSQSRSHGGQAVELEPSAAGPR